MKIEHLEELAVELGASRIRNSGTKIGCTCLLAKWTHKKGRDSNPSMVLFLSGRDIDEPTYSCSSCHKTGTVRDLVIFHWIKTRRNMMSWIELIDGEFDEEQFDGRKKFSGRYNSKAWAPGVDNDCASVSEGDDRLSSDYRVLEELEKVEEIPWLEYKPYLTGVPRYAIDRGLTIDTCREWDLGHDKESRRLLFPMKDHRGRLVAISGRSYGCSACGCKETTKQTLCSSCGSPDADEDEFGNMFCFVCGGDIVTKGRSMCANCGKYSSPKYLHSRGFKRNLMLYGIHRKSKDWYDGRVYVCEGHIDVLMMWQAGYRPVVGLLGSAPGESQVEMLRREFSKIIVVPDGDSAGRSMAKKLSEMIDGRTRLQTRFLPRGKDPASLTKQEMLEILGPPTFSVADGDVDC